MTSFIFAFYDVLWFWLPVLVALSTWLFARVSHTWVAAGALSTEDRRMFLAAVVVFGFVQSAILIAYGITTRRWNPLCSPGSSTQVLDWLNDVALAAFLAWLWFGKGAATIARFASLLFETRKPLSSRDVWYAVVLMGALGLFGVFLSEGWHASIQQTRCHESTPAPSPLEQWRKVMAQKREERTQHAVGIVVARSAEHSLTRGTV
jgi:hypothetical protein